MQSFTYFRFYPCIILDCGIYERRCNDGTCIPLQAWCNTRIDCPDKSDERNCCKCPQVFSLLSEWNGIPKGVLIKKITFFLFLWINLLLDTLLTIFRGSKLSLWFWRCLKILYHMHLIAWYLHIKGTVNPKFHYLLLICLQHVKKMTFNATLVSAFLQS